MQFIDEAEIHVKAGDGGAGAVAFRREKFIPRGGPSGGDGGNGADIILETDERLSTLLDFRFKREYKGKNGEPGRGRDQNGHAAEELLLRVPPGNAGEGSGDGRGDRRPAREQDPLRARQGRPRGPGQHEPSPRRRCRRRGLRSRAPRARRRICGSNCACSPMWGSWAIRTRARARSFRACRGRGPRSQTIRSPRCSRTSGSFSTRTDARSC